MILALCQFYLALFAPGSWHHGLYYTLCPLYALFLLFFVWFFFSFDFVSSKISLWRSTQISRFHPPLFLICTTLSSCASCSLVANVLLFLVSSSKLLALMGFPITTIDIYFLPWEDLLETSPGPTLVICIQLHPIFYPLSLLPNYCNPCLLVAFPSLFPFQKVPSQLIVHSRPGSRHVVKPCSMMVVFRPLAPPTFATSRGFWRYHLLESLGPGAKSFLSLVAFLAQEGGEDRLQPLVLRVPPTACFYAWASNIFCQLGLWLWADTVLIFASEDQSFESIYYAAAPVSV